MEADGRREHLETIWKVQYQRMWLAQILVIEGGFKLVVARYSRGSFFWVSYCSLYGGLEVFLLAFLELGNWGREGTMQGSYWMTPKSSMVRFGIVLYGNSN